MEARLIPESGGRPIRIDREMSVVGRKRWVCDIRLESDRVSKIHCLINRSQGRYYIVDLGSSNGTFVNGTRITEETEVCSGDELIFGNVKFTLRIDLEVAPSDAVPRAAALGETPLMAEMLDEMRILTNDDSAEHDSDANSDEEEIDEEEIDEETIGLSSGSFSGLFEEVVM